MGNQSDSDGRRGICGLCTGHVAGLYNAVRLHSVIRYVAPHGLLAGQRDAIHAERDRHRKFHLRLNQYTIRPWTREVFQV